MHVRVLAEADCDRIHQATLTVLETTGVGFEDCTAAQELFVKAGCRVDRGRVHFPPGVVADILSRVPDRNGLAPFFPFFGYSGPLSVKQGDINFGLVGNAFYLHDYATGESRGCLESDVNEKLLIIDALPNFQFDVCNLFTDFDRGIGTPVPRPYDTTDACLRFLRQWVQGRAIAGRKPMPLGDRNTVEEEQRLTVLGHAILEGADRTRAILDQQVEFTWCNPLSPLKYKAEEAEAIIACARSNGGWNSMSPEVMFGGSGPVTLAGSLVQHNAEVLAGVMLSQLASPGSACLYGCVSAPMDLRNADISQGHFETALFSAAVVQLADHYGIPSRIAPGNSSDRKPCARALAEAAVGLYLGASAGGNIITTGLLDSTIMISYEHMVMVNELIGQVRSVANGITVDADGLALDVIAHVGSKGGNYLDSDHTMEHMKRDVYYSDFNGRVTESFEESYDKAHRHVAQIRARRETDAHVEKCLLARLDTVETRLRADEATWRSDRPDWFETYVGDLG